MIVLSNASPRLMLEWPFAVATIWWLKGFPPWTYAQGYSR
jgi:hypothetical protein